jgi:STE24 endopeptidase
MAFGLLLWRTDGQPFAPLLRDSAESVAVALGQIPLWWMAARIGSARALRRLHAKADGIDAAQLAYHRTLLALRLLVFGGFLASVFLTRWPVLIEHIRVLPAWSGLADVITISPFLAGCIAVWHGLFPIDRALREQVVRMRRWDGLPHARVWALGEYLSFNVRHQLLIVAVPMLLILLTYRMCAFYRARLVSALLFPWVPDALLGLVAAGVFVFSPVLLKSIWTTTPLPDGPLRQRLEAACRRLGLRCRDILVWNSHGMMINAAVMGIFARWRYVLLSDGLLDGLREDQIEAVFGHEAGHVRYHHMQYFLLFAVASILLVSAIMETIVRSVHGAAPTMRLNETALQAFGVGWMALVWGVAFGWLSRRFERQADVCGAQCVSPAGVTCGESCGVHWTERAAVRRAHALCVTGAMIFVGALDRVAMLNGIPHEERSWRHSSIASRMRFLMAQAGDPALARAFQRLIQRLKRFLWAAVVLGGLAGGGYCLWQRDYRDIIMQNTLTPLGVSRTSFDSRPPQR